MLKNIGVRLNIRQIPSSEYSVIVTGKRFDMFYFGISQTDPCGIVYICQNYCSDSTLIKSGLNSPTLDAQLRAVNQLPTRKSSTPRLTRWKPRRSRPTGSCRDQPAGHRRRQAGPGQLRRRTVLRGYAGNHRLAEVASGPAV